jgi:damage control phosphatase ARMT1-like protein
MHFGHPLPPPLVASDVTSFAYTTITERLPAIARRVLAENPFPAATIARISALIEEIGHGRVHWFGDDGGRDSGAWAGYAAPFLGQRWTDIPCTFAETYFYRAILAATGYFRPGPWYHHDPYGEQKRLGLLTQIDAIQAVCAQLNAAAGAWSRNHALTFVHGALWGNRADLSLWPIDAAAGDGERAAEAATTRYLLVDDAPVLVERLDGMRAARVDIIVDNAGFELVCDLALADYLLTTGRAATVALHLKNHPTFVSDAMPADVPATLALLAAQERPDIQIAARRLQRHLAAGRLRLHTDPFWTAPLVFWEMPGDLAQQLAGSDMIIVKGDMNYRRLLGDRLWPFTTPFANIVRYFPAPLTALRTIKAELAAGLQPDQIRAAGAEDPEWLRNGRWGVIQLADPLNIPMTMTIPARAIARKVA